jgi:hypothetical protein
VHSVSKQVSSRPVYDIALTKALACLKFIAKHQAATAAAAAQKNTKGKKPASNKAAAAAAIPESLPETVEVFHLQAHVMLFRGLFRVRPHAED